MANYVFLMDFQNETMLTTEHQLRLITVSEIGCGLSLVCSVMTLCLLCFLPTKGDGLFIIGNMCVALMGAQLSFIGAENTSYPNPFVTIATGMLSFLLTDNSQGELSVNRKLSILVAMAWCKTATAFLHYLFLCVPFASLAFAQHLWFKLGTPSMQLCQKRGVYVAMVWCLPMVIVAVTAVWRGDDYAKDKICWLPYQHSTRLAFLLPLGVVLLLNGILYVMLVSTRIMFDLKKKLPVTTMCRHVLMTSLSLFPVLSLQWLLGLSVTFDGPIFFKYAYVVLCSGQGLCMLVFHVIPNGQIKRALCTKIAERSNTNQSSSSGSVVFTLYSDVEEEQKKKEKK